MIYKRYEGNLEHRIRNEDEDEDEDEEKMDRS